MGRLAVEDFQVEQQVGGGGHRGGEGGFAVERITAGVAFDVNLAGERQRAAGRQGVIARAEQGKQPIGG